MNATAKTKQNPGMKVVSNDNQANELNNQFVQIENSFTQIRGGFIGQYAEFEMLLAKLLIIISSFDEYSSGSKKFPNFSAQRADKILEFEKKPGPLKKELAKLVPMLTNFDKFEDMRNFFAHGAIEVLINKNLEPHFVLRFISQSSGNPTLQRQLFSIAEAKLKVSLLKKATTEFTLMVRPILAKYADKLIF